MLFYGLPYLMDAFRTARGDLCAETGTLLLLFWCCVFVVGRAVIGILYKHISLNDQSSHASPRALAGVLSFPLSITLSMAIFVCFGKHGYLYLVRGQEFNIRYDMGGMESRTLVNSCTGQGTCRACYVFFCFPRSLSP